MLKSVKSVIINWINQKRKKFTVKVMDKEKNQASYMEKS